ncbi:putative signal transducing protein [Crocinitomix catalasitica]|uniref:putative signal transducing protein n=1 Tax=Crocinitomix catalasitica TaxID=184607 RepID=UPI0004855D3E|nr:DUF2007 domain-containing protein [Crocinitomix catalasitica]|tara:strand:+ start:154 stop:360 length:207 start_codon:yes stop_codon:yes gene_type:complete
MENKVVVFSSTQEAIVHIIKGMLEVNNIPSLVFNQKDSSYNSFGEIDLLVSNELADEAKELIRSYQNN